MAILVQAKGTRNEEGAGAQRRHGSHPNVGRVQVRTGSGLFGTQEGPPAIRTRDGVDSERGNGALQRLLCATEHKPKFCSLTAIEKFQFERNLISVRYTVTTNFTVVTNNTLIRMALIQGSTPHSLSRNKKG